jgi:hypothetical protein
LNIWCTILPTGTVAISEPNDLFGEGEYIGVFPTKDGQVGMLFLATTDHRQPLIPQQHIAFLKQRFSDFGMHHPAMTTLRNAVIHLLPSSFLLQGMEPILKTQI